MSDALRQRLTKILDEAGSDVVFLAVEGRDGFDFANSVYIIRGTRLSRLHQYDDIWDEAKIVE